MQFDASDGVANEHVFTQHQKEERVQYAMGTILCRGLAARDLHDGHVGAALPDLVGLLSIASNLSETSLEIKLRDETSDHPPRNPSASPGRTWSPPNHHFSREESSFSIEES